MQVTEMGWKNKGWEIYRKSIRTRNLTNVAADTSWFRNLSSFPFLCPTSHPLVQTWTVVEKSRRMRNVKGSFPSRDPFSSDEKKKKEKEERKEKKKKKEGKGESRRIGVEEEQEEER